MRVETTNFLGCLKSSKPRSLFDTIRLLSHSLYSIENELSDDASQEKFKVRAVFLIAPPKPHAEPSYSHKSPIMPAPPAALTT